MIDRIENHKIKFYDSLPINHIETTLFLSSDLTYLKYMLYIIMNKNNK
jgi:hypothetical protein